MLSDSLFLLMVKLKYYIIILLLVLTQQACETNEPVKHLKSDTKLFPGADQLVSSNLELIKGKQIAVVANKASVLSDGTSLLDTLLHINGVNVAAVFTPEHGYNINAAAGNSVQDSSYNSIPFFSLYGKNKKPTPEMLKNIDIILYDIQDLGARFYTYISTLFYILEAAGENNIPVMVLDRPDPIGGNKIAGPVLEPDFKSFTGIATIPVMYGMTSGELAGFFAGEGLFPSKPELKVIRMKNWRRNSFFSDYNIEWVNPSPNIPDFETALIYPSTVFLEGTNVSEGRGTENPFKQIGAPFINSKELITELNSFQQNGISIKPLSFIPVSIPGKAENPKYKNVRCNGISINIENPAEFRPIVFGIQLLYTLHRLYPEKFRFESAFFDRLMGEKHTREMIINNETPDVIITSWKPGLENFIKIRTKYLLY